jgi:hypothetical protein
MTTELRTRIASILRQVEQGLLTSSAAYHRIAEIIYGQHGHA